MEGLNNMDFLKELMGDYEMRIKDFRKRESEISERLASLMAGLKDEEVLQAKISVKRRQREDALAAGNEKLAVKCEEDIKQFENEFRTRDEEIEALNMEREEIQGQIQRAAKETLDVVYPRIQGNVHKEWVKVLDTTEKAWTALQGFERQTGARVSVNLHRNALSPILSPYGVDRNLKRRFERWI